MSTALARTKLAHIILRGIPTTATSGDLRRAIMLAGLEGVTGASIVYKRFIPTGTAALTLAAPDFTKEAFRAAKNITFTGCEEIRVSYGVDYPYNWQRFRGSEGRANALQRGLLGSGPSAGFPPGRTVTITGVPGKATVRDLKPLVQEFQLLDDDNSVLQVPLPESKFSMYGRFVVMLASESEAQRLVRKLHLTPFKAGAGHYMTAKVIY